MPRWFFAPVVLVPLAVVAEVLHWPAVFVFGLSALALIPLAGAIGEATEMLAHHLGPRYGGLLNATFGNAAELIITILALREGLLTLVKASITGSIIGNTLLVLGLAVAAGGWRNGLMRFDPRETSRHSANMILAMAGLYLPAVFAFTVSDWFVIEEVSVLVAVVLLLTYLAYLWVSLRESEAVATSNNTVANHATPVSQAREGAVWSTRLSLIVLGVATAGAAVSSEILVGSVSAVTHQLGWTEFFVGVILVPIIGNAAEHFSAVRFAWRGQVDASLAIAAGSSTQIALFVAPLLVFLSIPLGNPMNLLFAPLELAILGLTAAIFAYISVDGEVHWLEGVQLLAVYLIAAVSFFFFKLPG